MKQLPLFTSLVVELISECNRSCAWCMRHADTQQRRFDADGEPVRDRMPDEHVRRILVQASKMGFRGQVTFYLMSEPFLDGRLLETARLARELKMRPYVNTNGDVLSRDPRLAREAGKVFHWVEVTVYEKNPAAAARVQARLRESIGPAARFKPLSAMGPRPHVPRPSLALPDEVCPRPCDKFIVQYDGSMPMCCYDLNTEFGLPNEFEIGDVAQAWQHPVRKQVAETLRHPGGRRRYDLCRTCPMPAFGYPPPFKEV